MLAVTLLSLPVFTSGATPPPEEAVPAVGAAAVAWTSPVFARPRSPRLYHGHTARYWASRYRRRTLQLVHVRRQLRVRWRPTVGYALHLASAVTGVSYWSLRSVSYCESTHNPLATNGRYKGLFQLSWAPFGFSPFDPVASALSTAFTVSREGWRQWECKP